MQIIDIGICKNNIDPKGIGRIRYEPYSLFKSEIENSVIYEDWDDNDPFIATPFLPFHINVIPQLEQSIKLIRYDTQKQTQNVEYMAGPYTSPHDVQNQSFTAQHKYTTYAESIAKEPKDIRSPDGTFNNPTTQGAVINEKDTGFRGNYGSDVIFTENGLQLRGGMLKSKVGKKKESLLNYPQMAKKLGRFSLKKFDKTLKTVQETTVTEGISVNRIKFIVEYELDNLLAPTELRFFIYKVLSDYGTQFNTNVFGSDSPFNAGDTDLVKLINTGNTTTDATYIKPLNGTIKSAYIELREFLYLFDTVGIFEILDEYRDHIDDYGVSHPFYYRPTTDFILNRGETPTEVTNKETF